MRTRAKKVKLTNLEQVEREMAKCHRRQERALLMERKAAGRLKRSAVELAKANKGGAKRIANKKLAIGITAAARPPAVELPVELAADTWQPIGEVAAAVVEAVKPEPAMVNGKPKRKRKAKPADRPTEVTELTMAGGFGISLEDRPKAGDPGPELLAEVLNKPVREAREAREARMQALGFRRTSRKK